MHLLKAWSKEQGHKKELYLCIGWTGLSCQKGVTELKAAAAEEINYPCKEQELLYELVQELVQELL